ncbi:MAG: FAD-dependent oxidoreductase [Pseudomonadales bacterium]
MPSQPESVDCCIVGAGPAGMMLGLLMARVGLEVRVLEMHQDFERDFRGDTVHASTLELLDQIGLADRLLALPHARLRHMALHTPTRTIEVADFSRLPSRFPFVAVMPQARFLEFLCAEAERYPGFRCIRGAAVQDLLREDGVVRGVSMHHEGRLQPLRAALTVAADGRFSRIRKLSGLAAERSAPPMDVCWLRLPRRSSDGHDTGAFFVGGGRMLVCLPRAQSWQIGYVFPKGDFAQLRAQGLSALHAAVAETAPWLADRVRSVAAWSDVHLLSVRADCLSRWHRDGLLLIGDAAHVMSPVGGVGINVAIGDAVAAANVLAQPEAALLQRGKPPESALQRIQSRRLRAVRLTQAVQSAIQRTLVKRALSGRPFDLPAPLKLLLATPGLRQLPVRIFALGIPRERLVLR